METAFMTDRGKIREHNEDNGGVFRNDKGWFFAVVADGMGGHRAGDVASELALEHLKNRWEAADSLETKEDAESWLPEVIRETNDYLLSYAGEHPECRGMGTTVVCAVCAPDFVTITHVGDSRCYVWGKEGLRQVTKDHSLVNELLRRGEISEEEAAVHPRKHVLLQAIGTEENIRSETETVDWEPGDMVFLCSDGLTNHVGDGQLEEVLRSEKPIQEKAQDLTEMANLAGGDDNITLTLVKNAKERSG
ncbi:MAG TPA: Stp1/IreP family PP2C-type Ser/Thr phosphatase [Bacillales bacterium]|nr:Stp1/IreP family PP2C-type Ser/Thr phosphatase [Bacillales bacterium]